MNWTDRCGAGLLASAILVSSASSMAADLRGKNLADFDFVTQKIAANYAGWDTKVTTESRPVLDRLTVELRKKVANASSAEMLAILQQWIGFFHDRHTTVSPRSSSTATNHAWPPRQPPLQTESQLTKQLVALGGRRLPIEGIWDISGRYRVAVVRSDPSGSAFDAIVVSTKAEGWKPGDYKAHFTRRSDGSFDVKFLMGDRAPLQVAASLRANNEVLDLAEFLSLYRMWPAPPDPDALVRAFPGDELFIKRLSKSTVWMRIPDFFDGTAKPLKAMLAEHRAEISSTPNLIIDVRGNKGGSDYVYKPLAALLYTRPTVTIGAVLRATEDNIMLRHEIAERLEKDAPEQSAAIENENILMRQHLGSYVSPEARPFEIDREDRALELPKHIAVLIDGAGSTGEQFLLLARQSRKVTLFGKGNSAGVLDFANVVSMPLPSGRFAVQWAISRSMRLPEDPVDPDGIAPDVRIPGDADAILYAQAWLERQSD